MPRKTTCLTALLGCTALWTTGLWAQESAVELDTITVSGRPADDDTRSVVPGSTTAGSKMATDILDTAASVSVITAKDIRDRGATTIEKALQYTPGVVTHFYGSDDRFDYIRVRGFDAFTYRDGLSLGAPFGALREEPYAYERIEVVKGANSSAFGISDPGGSVNYLSKLPRKERFGEVYATGGSFSHAELGFDFGDNITADSTLSWRLTGVLKDAEKEYDYSKDDETFLMGGLTWRPTDRTSVTLLADYLKRNSTPGSGGHPIGVDLDRSVFLGEPDYNSRNSDRKTISVMLDHDFGGGLTFSSGLRYSKEKNSFAYAYLQDGTVDPTVSTVVDRLFFGNRNDKERFSIDARLQYDTTFNGVGSRTLGGIEYWATNGDDRIYSGPAPSIDWAHPVHSGKPASVPIFSVTKRDNKATGVYLQQEFTFAETVILSLGLRHDWMDIDQRMTYYLFPGFPPFETGGTNEVSETTHRAALTWKITPEVSVYGSYAESVAPADLGIEPARGRQSEIGVKYRPDGMRALFTAAAYDLKKTNVSVTDPVTSSPRAIGEVRVKGVEVEAKAELTEALSLVAGWTHMKSEILENGLGGNEGNRVPFVPKEQASLWALYQVPGQDITLGLGARYEGSYFYAEDNTKKNAGFTTFDASFSYQVREDTALSVNVSNLFDKKAVANGGYGADWFNEGRTITATLRHTW
ncbi:TonB-dependent siderophore receptor [Paenirhodobacter sp.]|uniref:TonB-dependent siderophore receptor n=1 Tax=Paenirhodobacter sp. TaxID=1965326 RepID=UPI003B3D16B3